MLSLMYRDRWPAFRRAAAGTTLAATLIGAVAVCDLSAASTAISSQPGIGEDVVSGSRARDVLGFGKSIGDEAVTEQIFQSECASARSVASFARDAKGAAVDENGLASLLPAGAMESGPMGLSGPGLFNTITALHIPRATPLAPLHSENAEGKGVTAKSVSDQALAQFWEQSASADAAFNLGDSSVGAAAGPGPSNVLIPLPAAAWSALSVLGAMGMTRAIRRRLGR